MESDTESIWDQVTHLLVFQFSNWKMLALIRRPSSRSQKRFIFHRYFLLYRRFVWSKRFLSRAARDCLYGQNKLSSKIEFWPEPEDDTKWMKQREKKRERITPPPIAVYSTYTYAHAYVYHERILSIKTGNPLREMGITDFKRDSAKDHNSFASHNGF